MRKVRIIFCSEIGETRVCDRFDGLESEGKPYSFVYRRETDEGSADTRVSYDGEKLTVEIDGYYQVCYSWRKGRKTEGFFSAGMGRESVVIFTRELVVEYKDGATFIKAEYESGLMGEKSDARFTFLIKSTNSDG